MEIKELDKKQFILLTLLITFVVSIATGIVTVSLMNQVPKSVPQTINNVIQRTIEKVTTVEVPVPVKDDKDTKDESLLSFSDNENTLIPIYSKDTKIILDSSSSTNNNSNTENNTDNTNPTIPNDKPIALGEGVIVSDIGLILVESSILTEDTLYKIVLEKEEFNASVLKKFGNGFTILKISVITDEPVGEISEDANTGNNTQ